MTLKSINGQSEKPQLTSYDSGYEHSVEHWIELRLLVDEEQIIEIVEEVEEWEISA